MPSLTRRRLIAAGAALAVLPAAPSRAATAAEIDTLVRVAIARMYDSVPGARELHAQSKGMLMIPNVVKGGFIIGGTYGEGALIVGEETVGYYSLAGASFGLQAGVQSSHQAIFFMTDQALTQFRASSGWQVGADAEVTVLDVGLATNLNTATRTAPVIGVVFGQDGFMAGASLQGAKISRIRR